MRRILPCFDETDDTFGISKELPVAGCYNPKQVLELSGKHYLTGPVVFVRFNMEGEYVSLTMGDLHCMKVLAVSCITNMATGIQTVKHSHARVLEIANQAGDTLCRWLGAVIQRME